MPLKLNSTGGGAVTIDVPSTASTYTITAPARTGTIITTADSNTVTQAMVQTGFAGNGPTFSAYNSVAISVAGAGAWTKMALQTKEWDTANCFDATTNYRFTPNVAGYYHFDGAIQLLNNAIMVVSIYKNGGEYIRGFYSNPSTVYGGSVTGLVYMNGTTDYVELYAYNGSASAYNSQTGATYTFLKGFLARSA
jgi:hypothetical protein